jgi:transcriptional regulator with XRE-family HTH domain
MDSKIDEDLLALVRKIPLDSDKFPLAGYVVKLFRKRKKWTQAQLGKKLGVGKVMVHRIERYNEGLDLERRRLLCKLLDIPPILLGLGLLEQLHDFFQENEKQGVPGKSSVLSIDPHDTSLKIEAYRNVLKQYIQTSIQSSGLAILPEIEAIIQSLGNQIKNTTNLQEQKQWLYLQWEFHRLAAVTHTAFTHDVVQARRHINSALEIATKQLKDSNLAACIRINAVSVELLENNIYLARTHIDAALPDLKNTSAVVQCEFYGLASRIYHQSAQVLSDRQNAITFLKRSQSLFEDMQKPDSSNILHDERYIPIASAGILCELRQFDSLLAMKETSRAWDTLNNIEKNNPIDGYKRREGMLLFNKAQCYLSMGYPEIAVQYLINSFNLLKGTGDLRNIGQIEKAFDQIKQSSNSPDVQALDMALREYHATKHR